MEIKTPFINQEIGAGDIIANLTEKVGIKPCSGCKKRKEFLNGAIKFVPKEQTHWTAPPEIPEGWVMVKCVGRFSMFMNDNQHFIIWEIIDGKYKNSHSFCCGLTNLIDKKWAELTNGINTSL